MNFSNLSIRNGTVKNIHELIKTFRITLTGNLPILYVKLFKTSDNEYYAVPNYWIGTDTIAAYVYMPTRERSEEEAFDEIFSRGLLHFNPNSNNHKIEYNESYYEDLEKVPKVLENF